MGPNSIGIYCANKDGKDLTTSLIYFDQMPGLKDKNLSIVSQTGLTLSGLLLGQNYIQEVGISKIAAIGNKFDVNESDLLVYLESDKNTDAIALYLEDIKDGKRFMEQCKTISKNKPILLLKSGKTEKGKKAIISHTKSMAGDYKIIEAMSKQVGIITVEDFNELFTLSKIILSQPIPKGNKLAVISISGAGTVLSCDLAEKYGLELPPMSTAQNEKMREIFPEWAWDDVYNPLDIWASVELVGPDKTYKFAGETFLEEESQFNALVYLITGIKESEFDWDILHQININHPHIPIYMGFFGGDKKILLDWREILEEKYDIPTFSSLSLMMKCISKALRLS